ncbi:hypothetical protein MVEN_00589200 [Mycena venus]|uniref:Uncharacterized protein n=1 Tax=Mycena venus TaxID=2733690 RepID=A0A8H6YR44_9AGAR|nr:hypothetical protein MVEN_00589200 [Mycena venus]
MRLSVFDILHRGVVYSLLGISGWAVFVGVAGHRERKAALMQRAKACRPVERMATVEQQKERALRRTLFRLRNLHKMRCDRPYIILVRSSVQRSNFEFPIYFAAQATFPSTLCAHLNSLDLVLTDGRCCRLRYPSFTLDHPHSEQQIINNHYGHLCRLSCGNISIHKRPHLFDQFKTDHGFKRFSRALWHGRLCLVLEISSSLLKSLQHLHDYEPIWGNNFRLSDVTTFNTDQIESSNSKIAQ